LALLFIQITYQGNNVLFGIGTIHRANQILQDRSAINALLTITIMSSLKYYSYFAELSFPRRRESRQVYVFTGVGWIPAYAGMTKL